MSNISAPLSNWTTFLEKLETEFLFYFFKDLLIYSWETQREAETQAEGEAGPMQGARRGARSQVSRIMPRAEGSAKPLSHRGCPETEISTIPRQSAP